MSTNTQNNKNEEEIDLSSLFVIIGKGFTKLFNFIGSIFKGIFHIFILILIFFKDNFIKIGIAGLIGLIIGIFIDIKIDKTYGSELLVEPNFKSARQLYANINFYNDLVKQKDTVFLEKVFNLSKEDATSLKKFTIEPIKVDNDIITAYDKLILDVDTLAIKSYKYENFKNTFTNFDYKVHKITVTATKNDVFKSLEDVIISSIVKNKYFNRLKELTNENLNRTDSLYKQNLTQLDSLRSVYMKVMLEEAKKISSGTNIDLGGEKGSAKELELFQTNRRINSDLKKLTEEKSEKYEILNIISSFQPIGTEVKGVLKDYKVQLALLFSGLMIVLIVLQRLNTYLNNYKK